jgi:monoamine oxidase
MPKLFSRLQRRFRPEIARGRRKFLARTAATGAGLLLSNRSAQPTVAQSSDRQRIVIIGGGFAGLACGHEMLAAGYDVKILEARTRLGGRVLSFHDFIPGRVVEGGAELIGANHPTWVAYAAKFGLEFLEVSEDADLNMPIHLAGRLLDDATALRIFEEMEAAFDSLTERSESIDLERPWETINAGKLDRQSIADWIAGLDTPPLVKRLIRVQLASDNAIENSKASLLAMLVAIKGGGGERFWSDSEAYRCKGGNDQLVRHLAESLGQSRIQLGDAVTELRYHGPRAVVKCKSGIQYECDRVVIAVPPSTWPSIRFEPELPVGLRQQQHGVAVKFLTQTKSRFWLGDEKSQYSITDGPISQTWESTDAQPSQAGTADDPQTVGLTAFSGGPQAEICLGFPKATRDADYAAEFEKIYPGFTEQFLQSRFMDWPQEPYTLTGYSFPGIGQITSIGKALHDGLERLHFCGEHTCFRFTGYMEGGLFSGASLAQRIAEADGLLVR